MKLEVNVTKKRFFVILGAFLMLMGLLIVYAYNSNPANPAVFGHSANEIEGVCRSDGTGCPIGAGGVTFAGYTASSYPYLGGIDKINEKCGASFADSRICTSGEINQLWAKGQLTVLGDGNAKLAWVQGEEEGGYNCYDWTSTRSEIYGSALEFAKANEAGFKNHQYLNIRPISCSASYPIACCK